MPSQISLLVFYFYWSGSCVTSKMGLLVTTIVSKNPSTTVTKGTTLYCAKSLTVRTNNKMKTLRNLCPLDPHKGRWWTSATSKMKLTPHDNTKQSQPPIIATISSIFDPAESLQLATPLNSALDSSCHQALTRCGFRPQQHPRWASPAATVDGYQPQTSCHKEPQSKPCRIPRSQLFIFDEVYQEANINKFII